MTSRRSRRAAHGDALASAVGGVVCLAIAVGVLAGAPGAGVYVGLLAAWGLAAAVARGPYGTAGMSRAMQLLAAGGVPLAHPLRLAAGVGREDSPWPPTRLAAWWAVLVACLAGLAPWWAALAGARVPFRLTSPVGLAVSWCGWYLAVQGVLAARRLSLGLPPVQIEKQLVRERAVDLAAAGVLGAFVAVVVVVGLANAHQLALWAGLERHGAGSAGHDSFAGLGAGGAGAVGVAAGLLVAAAVGSRAYARAWLAPHRRRQHLAQSWYERWQAALGPRVPTPLFHEEQELPADAPSVFAATFEVPPGGKMDDYVACAERLAPALRTDTVLVSALPRTGAEGQVIFGTESAQYFQVQFPLVDVGPAPHLNRSLDRHALAFGVSYQFRQVFRELKLGQPTLYSLSVLSEDDSEGFMAEADWKLPPGVTFDSVAKAEGALRDKLEVPWLRVGRRSVRLPGQSVTPDLVSVVYGDGPERTTFKPSFGAHALQLIRSMEWDSRFRKCGLVRDGIGPTVVERTVLPDDMVDDVFEYAA
ncbi:MAG TPA: hypothetical protein VKV25_07140, partial [Acidimicrobiales bacterium]|nr:hypothetical protein [Acidimicrobiales bacterium]